MKNTKNINKKIIVSLIFCVLIFATMIYFIVSAAVTQHAESKDPAIDILEGLAATIVVVVGGFIVLYECDLFYTVYYLLFGQKRKAKTVLVILANITLIMIFIYSPQIRNHCVYPFFSLHRFQSRCIIFFRRPSRAKIGMSGQIKTEKIETGL